jgi:hypothetical protein
MKRKKGVLFDRDKQEYQTSVSAIEKKTGYRFFRQAPKIESIAKAAGRF